MGRSRSSRVHCNYSGHTEGVNKDLWHLSRVELVVIQGKMGSGT